MIRIDSNWLATAPIDMRAGTETALARVVAVFGAAQQHCAYLFANRGANHMKVLVHYGFGTWLAARRVHQGKFFLPGSRHGSQMELGTEQLHAWCWVCLGKESGQAALFPSYNGTHDQRRRAIVRWVYRRVQAVPAKLAACLRFLISTN